MKRLAIVVSLTALLSGAALFSASPAHASFPCEYGDEGGPSYDLGPACDSTVKGVQDAVDLGQEIIDNSGAFVDQQLAVVCRELSDSGAELGACS